MNLFKGLGNLGNLASMVREAQQMGGRVEAINEKMKTERVQGAAGGGLVTVEVNGLGDLLKVKLDPSLDREMIEDLIPAAVNQAVQKARERHAEQVQALTENMNLSGVQDMLSGLLGGADEETE
ncbi:MAG: YbaB/EbfC family nucleoid-associated protein [Planctomycetales bacterium]|nr:YbaB/EbfC family nucleoid-associated protein [Planctomycetales bacterium]